MHGARRPLSVLWMLALVSLALPCCSPPNTDHLVKEVLAKDPEFSAVLQKHRELTNRIQTYGRELKLKRDTIERNISQLRKDLAAAARAVTQKTDETKKRMDPDRERLQLSLTMAGEELRAKRAQRSSLGRSIAQLRKAVKGGGAGWSAEERADKDRQMQDMVQDSARLDQEMAAIKEHVRLLKIKLVLIKL